MMWLKRILVGLAILIVVAILATAIGYRRLKGVPDWYTIRTFTAEQLQLAASSAENKLADMQNWAAEVHAHESAATRRAPSTQPPRTATIEFTEDEINAFFQKWVAAEGWTEKFGQYVDDPSLFLASGRVIFAGTVKELNGTVASVHFEPKLDPNGNLDLRMVKVLGGKLPLPKALWSSQKQRLIDATGRHLPEWRRQAAIANTGAANVDAVSASLAQTLLHVLAGEVSEPVVFVPIAGRGAIPARLTAISVENRTLRLTVTPMTPAERETFLARLKGKPLETALAE